MNIYFNTYEDCMHHTIHTLAIWLDHLPLCFGALSITFTLYGWTCTRWLCTSARSWSMIHICPVLDSLGKPWNLIIQSLCSLEWGSQDELSGGLWWRRNIKPSAFLIVAQWRGSAEVDGLHSEVPSAFPGSRAMEAMFHTLSFLTNLEI